MEVVDKKNNNEKKSPEEAQELIKDLTHSVSLLPEFIIEPIKDYIKQEVTYRIAEEVDFLIEKKIDPTYKRQSFQHFLIMGLLLLVIITLLVVKLT